MCDALFPYSRPRPILLAAKRVRFGDDIPPHAPLASPVWDLGLGLGRVAVDCRSLGKHDLIVRFLKGARRMNPSWSSLVPSWDLSIVLAGLQRGPFEPLDSVELKFLSVKTALLTVLTSIKWVGDLQAFSVSEECLVFTWSTLTLS